MAFRMNSQAAYASPYRATRFITWHFPDFELRYLGTQKNTVHSFTITNYQFTAVSKNESIPISWSAGLGEIAPTSFKMNGRTYYLEMAYSDLLEQWIKGKFMVYPDNDPALAIRYPHYALANVGSLQDVLSLQTSGIGAFRLTRMDNRELSIGQRKPGKQECDVWYALPRGMNKNDEWFLPIGDYCLQSSVRESTAHFNIVEKKCVTVDPLTVHARCPGNKPCIFEGADVLIEIEIVNEGLSPVGFPLALRQKTGPSICLVNRRNKATSHLPTNPANPDLANEFTPIAPGQSVVLKWIIKPSEIEDMAKSEIDLSAEISVDCKIQLNGKIEEFYGSSTLRITGKVTS